MAIDWYHIVSFKSMGKISGKDWLGNYVNPEHLCDDHVDRFRNAFNEHPARLLAIKNFLPTPLSEQLLSFLESECTFTRVYGAYGCGESYVNEDTWSKIDDANRYFCYQLLDTVKPEYQIGVNTISYLRLRTAINDQRFKSWISSISGMPVGDFENSDVHAMGKNDFLRAHSDRMRDRRLAFVVYLTRNWRIEYGGALVVLGNDGIKYEIHPTNNSLVIFDVSMHKNHQLMPVKSEAGELLRYSIVGWFKNPAQ